MVMSLLSDSSKQSAISPWSQEEFTEELRQVGRRRYHDRHPFHIRMNSGQLTRDELQCWVANRYYYQKSIPVKDALLISRCPERDVRRHWVQRIVDHDGTATEPGGIEKWLRLGEGIGLSRNELEQERLLLPAVRFAVDAYVNFVAVRPWVEAVASSLTELFAPELMNQRSAHLRSTTHGSIRKRSRISVPVRHWPLVTASMDLPSCFATV